METLFWLRRIYIYSCNLCLITDFLSNEILIYIFPEFVFPFFGLAWLISSCSHYFTVSITPYCFVMLSHAGWWNGTINMYSYVIFCTDLASGSVWIIMASAKALKSNRNTRRTNPLLQEVPTQQAWSLWTTKFCGLSIQSKKDYNSPLHFEQQCKSLQDSLKKTWTESLQELSWRHFEQQCS